MNMQTESSTSTLAFTGHFIAYSIPGGHLFFNAKSVSFSDTSIYGTEGLGVSKFSLSFIGGLPVGTYRFGDGKFTGGFYESGIPDKTYKPYSMYEGSLTFSERTGLKNTGSFHVKLVNQRNPNDKLELTGEFNILTIQKT